MFKREGVVALYGEHKATLKSLVLLGDELKQRFYGIDDAIDAMILSVAAGEALLLIGPPGTAKSSLVRAFCRRIGLIDKNSAALGVKERPYFEYLLTQFTEPGELFGFYNLAALSKATPVLERLDAGMMQHARVVFLDEVFNASSAILNSLLAFMNERKFHDRGSVVPVRLEYLVGATNDIPTSPELRAFFDRFLLRAWVRSVAPEREEVRNLLNAAWQETHSPPTADLSFDNLLEQLKDFRSLIDRLTKAGKLVIDLEHAFAGHLADCISFVRSTSHSEMSNRRLVGFAKIILVQALLRAAREDSREPAIELNDVKVLLKFGVDRQSEELDRQFIQVA